MEVSYLSLFPYHFFQFFFYKIYLILNVGMRVVCVTDQETVTYPTCVGVARV